MTDFTEFGLAGPILQALADEGHTSPTPIQAKAISPIMNGRDLLGIAQTGTGKTAAFALPVLHQLATTSRAYEKRSARIVVLTPTRELAAQVLERFRAYGRGVQMRASLVIGGASIHKQKIKAQRGLDIVVATPGRLTDLEKQGAIDLSKVETFILDEVDQMLDLGFIHAIRAIAEKLPTKRQNIFFSATMPPAIARLADKLLHNPVRVEIAAKQQLKIDQSIIFLEKKAKPAALVDIVRRKEFTRGLVFSRTKYGADKLVRTLTASGASAVAIHGNRSQSQRERALAAFRNGKAPVLVATDIAARGIDVREVSHVINFDLPHVPETYVHRIGRTARAGAAGEAISFCSRDERPQLRAIEKLTKCTIRVVKQASGSPLPAGEPANDDRRSKHAKNTTKAAGKVSAENPEGDGAAAKKKRQGHDERGTARVRRRRHRGPAGRQLSRKAG